MTSCWIWGPQWEDPSCPLSQGSEASPNCMVYAMASSTVAPEQPPPPPQCLSAHGEARAQLLQAPTPQFSPFKTQPCHLGFGTPGKKQQPTALDKTPTADSNSAQVQSTSSWGDKRSWRTSHMMPWCCKTAAVSIWISWSININCRSSSFHSPFITIYPLQIGFWSIVLKLLLNLLWNGDTSQQAPEQAPLSVAFWWISRCEFKTVAEVTSAKSARRSIPSDSKVVFCIPYESYYIYSRMTIFVWYMYIYIYTHMCVCSIYIYLISIWICIHVSRKIWNN